MNIWSICEWLNKRNITQNQKKNILDYSSISFALILFVKNPNATKTSVYIYSPFSAAIYKTIKSPHNSQIFSDTRGCS